MSDDGWTTTEAWARAAVHVLLRSAAALQVSVAVCYGMLRGLESLGAAHVPAIYLLLGGSGSGLVLGWLQTRGLMARTGLGLPELLLPLPAVNLLVVWLGYMLTPLLMPVSGYFRFVWFGLMLVVGTGVAIGRLWVDS